MTLDQIRVATSSNLTLLKTVVPNEVDANAVALSAQFGYVPLLMIAVIDHKCTDKGHAALQYLLDQGADPNFGTFNGVRYPMTSPCV